MNSLPNKKSNYRNKMASLSVDGKKYPLYEGINTIGRSLTATVPLKHLDISKQQAIITIVNENQHYVSDFQSFNGTSLNRTKLQPLRLYKLSNGNSIEFANISAIYNMVSINLDTQSQNIHDYTASTQNVTQSFFNATTQAFINETTETTSIPEIERPQNYFDDDYNFEDVSTQIVPLSIHEMPTQTFCDDVGNTVCVASDNVDLDKNEKVTETKTNNGSGDNSHDPSELMMDIHEMETQKIEFSTSLANADKSIHSAPTQLVTTANIDTLDDTVVSDSECEQDSDSESQLRMSQLKRRSIRPITDDSQSSAKENSESEIFKFKTKKKNVIESDSETEAEDGDDNCQDERGDEKDLNLEPVGGNYVADTIINKDVSLLQGNIKDEDNLTEINSDSDIDDFEFNTQANHSNLQDDDDEDFIIPSTQLSDCEKSKLDDLLLDSVVQDKMSPQKLDNSETEDVNRLANSVEMDSLFLEPTQTITGEEICEQENTTTKDVFTDPIKPLALDANQELSESIFLQPTQITESANNRTVDDEIFVRPTQPVATVSKRLQINEDNIFDLPTQAIHLPSSETYLQPAQVSKCTNNTTADDEIFVQPTQPVTIASKPSQINDDSIFDLPTQAINAPVPEISEPAEINNTSANSEIFVQPTQPITIASKPSQINDDRIFDLPTQAIDAPVPEISQPAEINNTSADSEIFLQPTQTTTTVSKVLQINDDEIFDQPTQPINAASSEIFVQPTPYVQEVAKKKGTLSLRNAAIEDDIFDQPTQVVSSATPQRHEDVPETITQKLEHQLEEMFASQKPLEKLPLTEMIQPKHTPGIESQLEVIFDSQQVSVCMDSSRPSNPLLNELEEKMGTEVAIEKNPLITSNNTNSDTVTATKSINSELNHEDTSENSTKRKTNKNKDLKNRKSTRQNTKCEDNLQVPLLDNSVSDSKEDKDSNSKIDNDEYHFSSTLPLDDLVPLKTKETEVIKKRVSKRATRGKKNEDITKPPTLKEEKLSEGKKNKNKILSDSESENELNCKPIDTVAKRPTKSSTRRQIPSRTSTPNKDLSSDVTSTKLLSKSKGTKLTSLDEAVAVDNKSAVVTVSIDEELTNKKELPKRSTRGNLNKNRENAEQSSVVKNKAENNSSKTTTNKPTKPTRKKSNFKEAESVVKKYESLDMETNNKSTIQIESTEQERSKQTILGKRKKITEDKSATSSSTEDTSELPNAKLSKPSFIADKNERPKRNIKMPKKHIIEVDNSSKSSRSTRNAKTSSDSALTETSDSEPTVVNKKQTVTESKAPPSSNRATRGKRNLNVEIESNVNLPKKKKKTSDSDSDDFMVKTPSRNKKMDYSITESTPERNKRALKPKVVFTMLDNPELESVIRSLGGRVVDTVESCTVLVTGNLKRSQKLLEAVGQGKPICSPEWIKQCKKANQFLDPWDFILEDQEAEEKWKLSLKESLNRSKNHKLLEDSVVYLLVSNAVDVLRGAIESCGGKCFLKPPPKSVKNYIVVANAENKAKYSKFLNLNPPIKVVLPEAIFDGVLRQELHLEDHLLG